MTTSRDDDFTLPSAGDQNGATYHIRIESSTDGVIFDSDVRAFLAFGARPNETGFSLYRGFNIYEAFGHAQWQLDNLQEDLHEGDYETESPD